VQGSASGTAWGSHPIAPEGTLPGGAQGRETPKASGATKTITKYKANKLLLAGGIGTFIDIGYTFVDGLFFMPLDLFFSGVLIPVSFEHRGLILFQLLVLLVWAVLAIVAASRPKLAKAMLVFSIILAASAAFGIVINLLKGSNVFWIPYLGSDKLLFFPEEYFILVLTSYLAALVRLSLVVLAAVGAMQNMRNPKVSRVID
jgi:hypothetical protein